MIYQEDIMRVATTIAGFSMTEADDLRKACSKKIREMIRAQRAKFVDGAEREGYGRELGEAIFNKIEPFADYAFPKSHAYGYALIGYQNAWLKANYPGRVHGGAADVVSRRQGQGVGVSQRGASDGHHRRRAGRERVLRRVRPEPLRRTSTILFGLAAVRNVGEALVEKIVSEREANGQFSSIYDFVRRVDPMVLNRRTMESLIKAGAFDALGVPRSGFLLKVDEIMRRHARRVAATTRWASRRCSRPCGEGDGHDWEGTEIADLRHRVRQVRETRLRARDARHLHLGPPALRGGEPTGDEDRRHRSSACANAARSWRVRAKRSPSGGILAEVQIRTTKTGKQYARVVLEDLGGFDGDQLLRRTTSRSSVDSSRRTTSC